MKDIIVVCEKCKQKVKIKLEWGKSIKQMLKAQHVCRVDNYSGKSVKKS